jgi:hypothetical protein
MSNPKAPDYADPTLNQIVLTVSDDRMWEIYDKIDELTTDRENPKKEVGINGNELTVYKRIDGAHLSLVPSKNWEGW